MDKQEQRKWIRVTAMVKGRRKVFELVVSDPNDYPEIVRRTQVVQGRDMVHVLSFEVM